MNTKDLHPLRLCGILGIISFLSYLIAVVVSPVAYPGYSWMSQAVSDLSATTAPSRSLWNQLSCLYGKCGIVSIMAVSVCTAITKPAGKSFRLGIYVFAAMNWISAVGYDLFPLSQAGTGMTTFSDIMHVYVITVAVVLTSIISLILIIIGGIGKASVNPIAVCAAIAFAMMMIGAIGTGIAPAAYFGIFERFSVFSAAGFNAALGFFLLHGTI